MDFQFNSDNQTDGDAAMGGHIKTIVTAHLDRILDRLTRLEVHVGDVTGPRSGTNDKRATVEARPVGMAPISATGQAGDFDAAVRSAADKVLTIYDRQIGRRTDRKGH